MYCKLRTNFDNGYYIWTFNKFKRKKKDSFVDELKAEFKFHDYGFIDDV